MTENEYQRRLNKASNQAEFRAGLLAFIAVIGIVIYQIWEMFQ
jgi:hypothetical protein